MTSSGQEVRQRKGKKQKATQQSGNANSSGGLSSGDNVGSENFILKNFSFIWLLTGAFFLVYCCYWFTWYVETLHENQLWFSNIQEVEREISLRTECGLYYSYYKQLIQSPDLNKGVHDLIVDNATEHGRTINLLQRFNIYQEVVLAYLYRWFSSHGSTLPPILFYVYAIFKLNGLYIGVLFILTWTLTGGSWLAGLLSAIFFVVNLDDTTRVSFTVNLRECFGFPFFWCQILFICLFLRRSPLLTSVKSLMWTLGIFIFTYLFTLTWQFNQFILLLQAGAIYVLGLLHLAPEWKVRRILCLHAFALLAACLTQFGQPMLLGSLLLSFVPGAVVSLYVFRGWTVSGGIVNGTLKLVIQVSFTCILMGTIHYCVKQWLQLDADDHIFKFLQGKFGFADPRDFESRIYLCHGAFVFLENEFFWRTSLTCLFPLYMVMLCGCLFTIGKDILSEWCDAIIPKTKYVPLDPTDITDKPYCYNRRPEIAFLVIQSAASGLLAMMALRMKYLWTPHMCVLAATALGDMNMWGRFFTLVKLRKSQLYSFCWTSLCCFLLSSVLVYNFFPKYKHQMSDLREFYDPDTVQLMQWINNNTRPDESFAGSMQLLAGVKCCTGRHLTNHPHFEDKFLRDRTRQVYQIYGRKTPREVYDILHSFTTDYIILEDSICLARSDGCRTPDLVDLDNWHIPDNGYSQLPGLKKSAVPRFCVEIRNGAPEFTKYFKLVLENRTFRVYKLL